MNEWLNRKRRELAEFDLSSLTAAGWLLFLSSIIVPLVLLGVYTTLPTQSGQPMSRRLTKVIGVGVFLIMIAWYQGGKFLLGKAGIRTYRTKRSGKKKLR